MVLESLKPLHQVVAGEIEILEDCLESFHGCGFDSDQSALDIRSPHRIEKLGVLAGFHRDLGKEHHVLGQLRQLAHELKTLGANTPQFFHSRRVPLLVRQTEQNEQCLGQPRTVWTEAHIYLSRGARSQRAGMNWSPEILPPS